MTFEWHRELFNHPFIGPASIQSRNFVGLSPHRVKSLCLWSLGRQNMTLSRLAGWHRSLSLFRWWPCWWCRYLKASIWRSQKEAQEVPAHLVHEEMHFLWFLQNSRSSLYSEASWIITRSIQWAILATLQVGIKALTGSISSAGSLGNWQIHTNPKSTEMDGNGKMGWWSNLKHMWHHWTHSSSGWSGFFHKLLQTSSAQKHWAVFNLGRPQWIAASKLRPPPRC